MKPCTKRSLWGAGFVVLVACPAQSQTVNTFPKPGDPLPVRMELYDELIRGNHWNEGAVMGNVVLPPVGEQRPIIGPQEDCPTYTAGYLAALSFRYALTREPEVRAWADMTMDGILKLERVTGVRGCVARSFNKTAKPNWHEQLFFFPLEWHESESMRGYRWMGDLSSDQFTTLIWGVTIYWELCADEQHKRVAADFVDRIIERCVDNNFRIVDPDNKMTLWGNFSPDLPHEYLNALLILAHLKTAYRLTGKSVYEDAYRHLVTAHHYDDEAILAGVLWPKEWRNDGNERLAAEALYHLMRFEDLPDLLQKYRMTLNRYWYLWKETDDPFFHMVYACLSDKQVVDARVMGRLQRACAVSRGHETWSIPTSAGMRPTALDYEDLDMWALPNYWFARYLGLLDASGAPASTPLTVNAAGDEAGNPANPAPQEYDAGRSSRVDASDGASPQMLLVPGGPFLMGSESGDADERPQHTAETAAFLIDQYEVSNAEYKSVFPPFSYESGKDDRPAVVTWEQAAAYAGQVGKRLPTEAEWEKAARGTDGRVFPWGNSYDPTFVAWDEGAPRGSAIAAPASPYGCYDMAGSVWEWTADWYKPYPGNSVSCEQYGEKHKVIRGGAAFNDVAMFRTTHRYYLPPNTTGNLKVGFRCGKDVVPEKP